MTQTYKFLDGVTADANGTSPVLSVDTSMYQSMIVQISITTAASVSIQGRIPPITGWATLNDSAITTSKAVSVKAMPEMRVVATGINGALSVYGVTSKSRAFT